MKPIYALLKTVFPSATWNLSTGKKNIYLTFDDGPLPGITPFVLETLKQYNAKATFFCVGENVQRNEDLFRRVIEEGHAAGNHTFSHLNGWKTSTPAYLADVEACRKLVPSALFRPPYGKLRPAQYKALMKKYRIVMWNVLSRDYDSNVSAERCLENVIENAGNGSIIVFHDNYKSEKSLRYVLPRVLEHFSGKGFGFGKIKGE